MVLSDPNRTSSINSWFNQCVLPTELNFWRMRFHWIPIVPCRSLNLMNPQECSSRTNHVIILTIKVMKKAYLTEINKLLKMMIPIRVIISTSKLLNMKWSRFVLIKVSTKPIEIGKLSSLSTRAIMSASWIATSQQARHLYLKLTFNCHYTSYIDLSHSQGIKGERVPNCMVIKLPWILPRYNSHHWP